MNDSVRLPATYLNLVHFGDCRDSMRAMIAAGVRVNTCVTSPPYWGLRDYGVEPSVWGGDPECEHRWGDRVITNAAGYDTNSKVRWNHQHNGRGEEREHMQDRAGWTRKEFPQGRFCQCGAWLGALGLEPDYRMFIAHMVEVFSLVRELLTDDGTCWMNLGDSYASGGGRGEQGKTGQMADRAVVHARRGRGGGLASPKHAAPGEASALCGPARYPQLFLKPKDLCMMPHRCAIALQEAGWWVRQDIVWSKPNPMPESVTDRCTKSHEYVFLLSKRDRYFYDADAVLESVSPNTHARLSQDVQAQVSSARANGGAKTNGNMKAVGRKFDPMAGNKNNQSFDDAMAVMPSLRNKRSVWTVATQPFKGAHFATFPPALIEPCILAGTSAHGHCSSCGRGWERVVEKGEPDEAHKQACGADSSGEYHGEATKEYTGTGAQDPSAVKARILEGMRERVTTGWKATCKCDAPAVRGIVFDPFMGSGTTAQVAQSLGRNWVGCELNEAYAPLQQERTRQTGMAL